VKTLRKGRVPEDAPRWVGAVVNCCRCNFSARLERGDTDKVIVDRNGKEYMQCPTPKCGNQLVIPVMRDGNPTVLG